MTIGSYVRVAPLSEEQLLAIAQDLDTKTNRACDAAPKVLCDATDYSTFYHRAQTCSYRSVSGDHAIWKYSNDVTKTMFLLKTCVSIRKSDPSTYCENLEMLIPHRWLRLLEHDMLQDDFKWENCALYMNARKRYTFCFIDITSVNPLNNKAAFGKRTHVRPCNWRALDEGVDTKRARDFAWHYAIALLQLCDTTQYDIVTRLFANIRQMNGCVNVTQLNKLIKKNLKIPRRNVLLYKRAAHCFEVAKTGGHYALKEMLKQMDLFFGRFFLIAFVRIDVEGSFASFPSVPFTGWSDSSKPSCAAVGAAGTSIMGWSVDADCMGDSRPLCSLSVGTRSGASTLEQPTVTAGSSATVYHHYQDLMSPHAHVIEYRLKSTNLNGFETRLENACDYDKCDSNRCGDQWRRINYMDMYRGYTHGWNNYNQANYHHEGIKPGDEFGDTDRFIKKVNGVDAMRDKVSNYLRTSEPSAALRGTMNEIGELTVAYWLPLYNNDKDSWHNTHEFNLITTTGRRALRIQVQNYNHDACQHRHYLTVQVDDNRFQHHFWGCSGSGCTCGMSYNDREYMALVLVTFYNEMQSMDFYFGNMATKGEAVKVNTYSATAYPYMGVRDPLHVVFGMYADPLANSDNYRFYANGRMPFTNALILDKKVSLSEVNLLLGDGFGGPLPRQFYAHVLHWWPMTKSWWEDVGPYRSHLAEYYLPHVSGDSSTNHYWDAPAFVDELGRDLTTFTRNEPGNASEFFLQYDNTTNKDQLR
eukprot:gene26361-32333_t